MSLNRSNTRALLAGLALILVSNAIALGGIAYNRSGKPASVLRLTERELQIQNWSWPYHENSGIDLHLFWRVQHLHSPPDGSESYWDRQADWLNEAQLRSLGFDLPKATDSQEAVRRYLQQPAREVFLALEYDGPAYRAVLEQRRKALDYAANLASTNAQQEFQERLKSAQQAVQREEQAASRLFVVAADLDSGALRNRYPDRGRYAIVRGQLTVTVNGETGSRRVTANVAAIHIGTLRVPHPYRALIEPLATQDSYFVETRAPRFAATVNFGRRLEPWIVELTQR